MFHLNMKRFLKKIKREKGFTLVELLVVLTIIGVLATILMVNFVGIRQRARDSQRKGDLLQIQSALELYRADQGTYPIANELPCGVAFIGGVAPNENTYMQKVPCDPLGATYYNGGEYVYISSDGMTYSLAACLENPADNQKAAEVPPEVPATCDSDTYYILNNP